MKTLEEIKGRCVVKDGHWLWRGALRPDGRPCIYAPDFTRHDGRLVTQCGMRAVWHTANGKAVPEGWRVYGSCDEWTCCNPAHVKCTSEVEFGQWLRETKRYRGQTKRILASRATGRRRAALSPLQVAYVMSSDKTGLALAAELGVSPATLSRYRRGQVPTVPPAGGMFSGLIAGGRA
ncbi:hypothetical protein [Acidovorax sp. Root219]|uniref:hypothetical protein n=1 Tax=Acidovorax sp. Root219 TaxID=1736493 RepID=UPI00070B3BC4|nr:hypothetical protein [Acidovorax sp. Root219]KRC36253.1 hypothetical protein ASE28_01590 [Acidovorax sp. Root219]